MHGHSMTDRRSFLSAALTATGSTLALGVCPPGLQGQRQKNPTLSFDRLYDTSVTSTTLTGEAADRLALRRLVDAWAHCADRRLAEEQSNLFIPDGMLLGYDGDPATHQPTSTLKGRSAIRAALAVLNKFTVTLHVNGQSEVLIRDDRAIGETYCLAHEIWSENGQRKLQTLGIRYYDQFVRRDNQWYFAERKLIEDWVDTRISVP